MKQLKLILVCISIFISTSTIAATHKYIVDVRQKHAYIQFKVSHLGFSYVLGEFEKLKGAF